ncbi:MAG: hypothetical protein GX237_08180 [Clostridiales bacterium]|nr:hypothetical protein [Clostridiales bacterium]
MEWKMTWSYLPVNHDICIGTISNTTLRGRFINNLDGEKIRIKFSNLYSPDPLILDNVTVAKIKRASNQVEGFEAVKFKGKETIRIEAGEEFYSDEIDFAVSSTEDIVLSIYVKEETNIYSVASTWSAKSWYTRYGVDGNYTRESDFPQTDNYDIYPVLQYDVNRANHIYGISSIELFTDSKVKTLALFGDSITHMSYYSDALTNRLTEQYPGKMTIVNRGLGGNRIIHDYSRMPEIPGGGTIFGGPGVERFEGDIFKDNTPDRIIVLIGINDITHPYSLNNLEQVINLDQYKNAVLKLIDIAHNKGSKIMLGTILPFKYEETEWFTEAENLRLEINKWIREQKHSDGVIDFDLAIRDENTPEKMDDGCHLGDGIHPNDQGGKRMADVVPLELFIEEE